MPDSERGYRWGRFQGWSFVVIGLLIDLGTPLSHWDFAFRVAMYATGAWHVIMGIGLVGRKRYGLVLFYVMVGLMLLTALRGGFHPEGYALMWYWLIPGIFYYPKRWKEFGKNSQEQQIQQAPTDYLKPMRELTDVEREEVLARLRGRADKS